MQKYDAGDSEEIKWGEKSECAVLYMDRQIVLYAWLLMMVWSIFLPHHYVRREGGRGNLFYALSKIDLENTSC